MLEAYKQQEAVQDKISDEEWKHQWKQATRKVRGIWKDRTDLPENIQSESARVVIVRMAL